MAFEHSSTAMRVFDSSRFILPGSKSQPHRQTTSQGSSKNMGHSRSASDLLGMKDRQIIHSRSASSLLSGDDINASDTNNNHDRNPGMAKREDIIGRNGMHRSEIADLVHFLRNHPPPRDNFMSQPEDQPSGGRWALLKSLGRRHKPSSTGVRPIRLPDSAVSGITIGGHRHIAISIPLEATPFNESTQSRDPVHPHGGPVASDFKNEPLRFTDETGVVTVLRTVDENPGSKPISARMRTHHPQLPHPGSYVNRSHSTSSSLSFTRTGSRGQYQDYYSLFPKSWDRPLPLPLNHAAAGSKIPHDRRMTHDASKGMSHSSQGLCPARKSSFRDRITPVMTSIDGVLGDKGPSAAAVNQREAEKRNQPRTADQDYDDRPLLSRDDDKFWDAPERPVNATSSAAATEPSELADTTIITEDPLGSDLRAEKQTTLRDDFRLSRRDQVRYKKRRDMAALRQARVGRREGVDKNPEETSVAEAPAPVQTVGTASIPTLSPIVVVHSIEPDQHSDDGIPLVPQVGDQTPSITIEDFDAVATEGVDEAGNLALESGSTKNNPSHLMPTVSERSPSRRKPSYHDRTSLSRRREWNAVRQNNRKLVEAKLAAQVQANRAQLREDETVQELSTPSIEDAYIRLFETYREHRLNDMERRMRRLERHGDVWLRALIPILESLNNHVMARDEQDAHEQDEKDEERLGALFSDDSGSPGGVQTRGRARTRQDRDEQQGRGEMDRSMSQFGYRDALDIVVDESARSSSIHEGVIEPLMRALAVDVGKSRMSDDMTAFRLRPERRAEQAM